MKKSKRLVKHRGDISGFSWGGGEAEMVWQVNIEPNQLWGSWGGGGDLCKPPSNFVVVVVAAVVVF